MKKKQLYKNITIMKTETLNKCMIDFGFTDFNLNIQKNKYENVNYYDYLNKKSIKLINNHYDFDFKLFDYEKILV